MKFNYELSDSVLKFIKDAILEEISIGCSDSQVFKIIKNNNIYFIKIAKGGLLKEEYEKLKWLDGKLTVPKIVLYDSSDNTEYLITESLKGEMICNTYYENNPLDGIKVITDAFRQIYSVNIDNCPFNNSIDYKLSKIESNVNNKIYTDKDLKIDTLSKFGSIENVLKFLKENRFDCDKCFSHGDPSLPNIFGIKDKFTGFIDVGECGISDKWFDLAICEKSIIRNYGDEWVDRFYEELNIIPDRDKIDYYLLMMEIY